MDKKLNEIELEEFDDISLEYELEELDGISLEYEVEDNLQLEEELELSEEPTTSLVGQSTNPLKNILGEMGVLDEDLEETLLGEMGENLNIVGEFSEDTDGKSEEDLLSEVLNSDSDIGIDLSILIDIESNKDNDKFDFLMNQEPLTEDELKPREILSKSIFNENDETEIPDLNSDEFENAMDEVQEQYDMDSTSEIPNIPVEELDEYILIKGLYSVPFKNFISSDELVPRGDFPLAIEVEGNLILFKKINPEPKTLYILKKVLQGFEITYVKGGISKELDVFEFLGKVKISI